MVRALRGEAVGGREPEPHLSGRQVRVGILAADGQAGCAYKWSGVESTVEVPGIDAHAVKLWAVCVEAAAIALLPVRHCHRFLRVGPSAVLITNAASSFQRTGDVLDSSRIS